jgi:hypothetical protein
VGPRKKGISPHVRSPGGARNPSGPPDAPGDSVLTPGAYPVRRRNHRLGHLLDENLTGGVHPRTVQQLARSWVAITARARKAPAIGDRGLKEVIKGDLWQVTPTGQDETRMRLRTQPLVGGPRPSPLARPPHTAPRAQGRYRGPRRPGTPLPGRVLARPIRRRRLPLLPGPPPCRTAETTARAAQRD